MMCVCVLLCRSKVHMDHVKSVETSSNPGINAIWINKKEEMICSSWDKNLSRTFVSKSRESVRPVRTPTSVSIKTNNKLDCQLHNNDLMVVKRPGRRTKDMRNHQTARACRQDPAWWLQVLAFYHGAKIWVYYCCSDIEFKFNLLIPSTSWVFP